ncbi:MAG: ATP-binding protein [Thermoguttaceae bacterium]|nr:ATP-binding protein [Thermoguttaceae bacterium]
MNNVALSKIQIKKLFNRFDYYIDFNNGENVSILTAPNGCGKTTIFNFINFIFNPSYESLNKIILVPFESFECIIENGTSIKIERVINKKARGGVNNYYVQRSNFNIYKAFQDNIDFVVSVNNSVKTKLSESLKSNRIIKRPMPLPNDSEEEMFPEERFMSHREYRISRDICIEFLDSYRQKVQKLITDIPITFISANRISDFFVLFPKDTRYFPRFRYPELMDEFDERFDRSDPLAIVSREFIEILRKCNSNYQARLSEAKDKLPNAFLQAQGAESKFKDFEEFKQAWNGYQEKLTRFKNAGLIGASDDRNLNISSLDDAYKNNRKFLETYISVFGSTVNAYEDIYQKIDLFSKILNKRNELTHKVVKFSENGIQMEFQGEPLDLNCLSSGEKNDFVMFYNLIFKAKTNGVILVDEPEISLHIEWQEEYLDHLIKICRLNNMQAIVATHSPNIISRHCDLILDFVDEE